MEFGIADGSEGDLRNEHTRDLLVVSSQISDIWH